MVIGRLTHYAFDAVLVSAFLAGVKRSTGLTPAKSNSSAPRSSPVPPSPPLSESESEGGEHGVGISSSPSLNSDKVTENKDFKKWIDNYLGVGEWVMDQSIAVLGSTSYFERKR